MFQSSPNPNNSRSEADLMNKVLALQREFAAIDINHDSNIRREELYSYLDRKTNTTFDRAIADELFDHMDKDQNQNVTVNEFIRVYIEADEMLQKKIGTAKANLQNYKRQQEEFSLKAREERVLENQNANAAHNSVLYVTIIEATFRRAGPTNPYVEISIDDQQRVKTRSVLGGQHAAWDEQVTLQVFNPDGILRFIVFNSRNIGEDTFEGEIAVQIEDLQDQNSHEVNLNLFDQTGNQEIGELHVNIQWIHSKSAYYENLAKKWAENYRTEEEELQEYERYLQTLYLPFPSLSTVQPVGATGTTGTAAQPPVTLLDRKIMAMMNQAARNITQEHPSDAFWKKILLFICFVEITVAVFISFDRAVFLDLLLTTLVVLELRNGLLKNLIPLKYVAIGFLVSAVVYDIGWLWVYSGNWTNVESYDIHAEGGTRSFVVFFTYINFIIKVLLGIVCYTFSLHLH